MDRKEQIELGMKIRFALEGIDPDDKIVKIAMEKAAWGGLGMASLEKMLGLIHTIPKVILLGAPAVGGALGYLTGGITERATRPSPSDIAEVKQEEVLNEYKRALAKIRSRKRQTAASKRRKEEESTQDMSAYTSI
jgi:hypothetical protein